MSDKGDAKAGLPPKVETYASGRCFAASHDVPWLEWTEEDNTAAQRSGWSVEFGRIVRIDRRVWRCDAEAIESVLLQATAGVLLAIKAAAIHFTSLAKLTQKQAALEAVAVWTVSP